MNEILRKEGLLPENCMVHNSGFGIYTEIGDFCHIQNSQIGDYSYMGQLCILQNTEVGKFSNIAAMVRTGPTAHPMERPTLHHFTYRRKKYGFSDTDEEAFFARRASIITTIGHDTWIGHGAVIMPGVSVGHGSVIGAGAIVTRDIPDYVIAVGCPARPVKERFTRSQAQALREIRWWDWTYEQIKERLDDFYLSVDVFIEKYRRDQ
ncbi:MAG: hypothetical protein JW874_04575 [Spirochaetales bacterium]|nr:hypothetical protein [Spirochaetales bacterium]